ncbi:GNAT family N-acetyltransferase [Roseobacter sp. HKCCA0434]|uniref:GNAT family N-acetyltransferase n=1 Tax=Roseobacter sp. HKCCA0434 TaxID=3079297 RepID=UPI0029059EC1|nr:GNAT family N-acetyltransferase [Roseobacter sp. HKCCA0434]
MIDLVIRAPRPDDAAALATLLSLPGVRHGTMRLPHVGEAEAARRLDAPAGVHLLVAERGGTLIGDAALIRGKDRRAHVAGLYVAVHDDHVGQGVGTALLSALIDLADNWLGLTRLELEVNTDNAPALALYRRFGFEIEGTKRRDALRDGRLIDNHMMARLRDAPT